MQKFIKFVNEFDSGRFFVLRYDAGDHVAVYPTNDPELVEKIGQILNIDLDVVFSLVNKDGRLFLTETCRQLFKTKYFLCFSFRGVK